MKQFFLLCLFIATSFIGWAQPLSDKLDNYFEAAQQAGLFNGSVLVAKDGTIVLVKGYGVQQADTKQPATANTIYQVGSITKQFTSTLILQLVQQGKMSLSDQLSKYFPSLPRANDISIENLLSHTSGIWNYTNDNNFMQTRVERPLTRDSMFMLIQDKPLDFEPGTKYSYSNSGYLLLGYIIEKVTGEPYEKLVRRRIFEPLNMQHSGFDFSHLRSADKATGYNTLSKSSGQPAQVVDSTVSFSAGSLYTTVGDLYKWNKSLGSGKIISKESQQNAFTPRFDHYGLGWVMDTVDGRQVITHGGGIHGFVASNFIVPGEKVSVTFLSNNGSSKMNRVYDDVLAILFDKPFTMPVESKEMSLDTTLLKQYVGEYQLAPTFTITVRLENGSLKAQATNQPAFDIYASSADKFYLKVVDAQIDFVRNAAGDVDKLILHQNGRDMPGQKIK